MCGRLLQAHPSMDQLNANAAFAASGTTTPPPPPPPPAPPKVEEKDAYPSTVLGYPLRRLKHLVDVVHDWVNKNKTGRIDWEAIGRAMSLPHGGEWWWWGGRTATYDRE